MTCLKTLRLADPSDGQIEGFSLSEDISKLKNLESLQLCEIRNLCELPQSIETLSCLTELKLYNMSGKSLPDSVGNLKHLKILEIFECPNIYGLLSSIGNLDSLEELQLWCCDELTELPDVVGKFNALKVLILFNCRKLTYIPDSFADLILDKEYGDWSLKKVDIFGCGLVLSAKMKQAMEVLKSRGVLVEE